MRRERKCENDRGSNRERAKNADMGSREFKFVTVVTGFCRECGGGSREFKFVTVVTEYGSRELKFVTVVTDVRGKCGRGGFDRRDK